MVTKSFLYVGLFLALFNVANCAFAQRNSTAEKEKTLIDRIDDMGKSLLDGIGILPAKKSKSETAIAPRSEPRTQVRSPAATTTPYDDLDLPRTNNSRAGSILAERAIGTQKPAAEIDDELMPENTPPAVPRAKDYSRKPVKKSLVDELVTLDEVEQDRQQTTTVVERSAVRPLHERMSSFRQSAFEAKDARPSQLQSKSSDNSSRPSIIAQRTAPEPELVDSEVKEPVAEELGLDDPSGLPSLAVPSSVSGKQSPPTEQSESSGGVLFTRKGPLLNVETLGPRRIAVGKESTYEVSIINSGEVAAEEVTVFVSLPEWAEVVGADVSVGATRLGQTGQAPGVVQWNLGHLEAKGRQQLSLRIVPRQSRPFDLAVRWDYKPVATQAVIEVQEPKLALELEGPKEVLYGKQEMYRLRVSNSGNGAAENVVLMLMPIGGGENVPATYKIGLLPPGEQKILDVELTARQAGNLTIQMDARADGGIHTELSEKVFVRRAGLRIDAEGPKVQFVGSQAAYTIRVRNPGTAPAKNVRLTVTLPAGAKYLSGIEGARLDPSGSRLEWNVETISPEVEQSFVLKCILGAAGISRVEINATADDDLTASTGTVTRVEAVANLFLEVIDPEKPVPLGEEATYELRVRNRGTKEARGVEVFAYFSRGIEPVGAEGGQPRLGPGQVIFQPIEVLAPGAEAVLRVRAKAEVAGNHLFRAEAHCKPLGARLVRETSNLYYDDTGEQTAREPGVVPLSTDANRTGSRAVAPLQAVTPPRQ